MGVAVGAAELTLPVSMLSTAEGEVLEVTTTMVAGQVHMAARLYTAEVAGEQACVTVIR